MGPVLIGPNGAVIEIKDVSGSARLIGKDSKGAFNTDGWAISTSSVNFTASGYLNASAFYESSDARLKDFVGDIDYSFEDVRSIPKKYYYWKDKTEKDGFKHIGTSAQELLKICPEAVSIGENGYYSVDYAQLSIVALSMIDKLHQEIEELKSKLG
jgi:hypothetical protein